MPTLLLCDDSLTVQRLIALTFADQGIEVTAVGDGEQAIARMTWECPDIVLASIGAPKRTGYDVAAFMKSSPGLSATPVLLLAAAFEPVDEVRAAQVRCDGVLVKPLDPQLVVTRVMELLRANPNGRGEADKPRPTFPTVPREADRPRPTFPTVPREADRPRPTFQTAPRDADRPRPTFPTAPGDADTPRPTFQAEPPSPERPGTVDDYFERLDAAFAQRSAARATLPADDVGTVPTVDAVLQAVAPAPAASAQPAGTPLVTDGLIDEVTRRVVERLGTAALREIVADVVADVAERLIREEIARIRNRT